MPDATGIWDADYIPDPDNSNLQHDKSGVQGLRSIRDCVKALMQDQILDKQLAALRRLSLSNLYFIILGTFYDVYLYS